MRITGGSVLDHALGSFGLFMIGLTVWAAKRQRVGTRMNVVLTQVVLAWVTVVGWIVDRVPLPDPQRATREEGPTCARAALGLRTR